MIIPDRALDVTQCHSCHILLVASEPSSKERKVRLHIFVGEMLWPSL